MRDERTKLQIMPQNRSSGDFVYLDAGTTTELMIEYITSRQAVFVSNAMSHAKRLAERIYRVSLSMSSGSSEAIVGEEAVTALEKSISPKDSGVQMVSAFRKAIPHRS